MDSYHIYIYSPQWGKLYRNSLFRRVMPANLSYDEMMTSFEKFISLAAKYKVAIQSMFDVTKMTDQNGLIIKYGGTTPPTELRGANLPSAAFDIMNEVKNSMNYSLSISPSTMGASMSGSKKFKAMETQKQADMFNTAPAIAGLRKCLTDMTKGIVKLMSSNMQVEEFAYGPKDETTGMQPKVHMVGESYYNSQKQYIDDAFKNEKANGELVIIKQDMPVKVEIANGLDYTDQGIRSVIIDLVKEGVLKPQAVKEAFGTGEILKYINEYAVPDQPDQNQPQNGGQPQAAPAGGQGQPQAPMQKGPPQPQANMAAINPQVTPIK